MFTVSVSLALALTGCGGGGGGGGVSVSPPVSVIEGFVSDGPIENARVFLDINCNGEWDAGEPFSITNNEGYYRLEYGLDSGTDYLLVAEGSSELNTQDRNDNPDDENRLTFVMFVKITTDGKRNSPRLSTTYKQDVTPLTFKSYLNDINTSMGGMNDPIIDQIIASGDTGTKIFKEIIKVNQIKFKSTVMYIAKLVQLSNTEKDLQATKTETLKTITNKELVSVLRDGNTKQDFPGLGSYIDTKAPYRGNDMFLGLSLDNGVKDIINKNFSSYLNLSKPPEFCSDSGSFDGITIDSSKKMINVVLNETSDGTGAATITVNWSFGVNKIVRSYEKKYVDGEKKGSTHSSIYTYSTGTNYTEDYVDGVDTKLTNVVFKEAINERYLSATGYTQTLSASYEGTSIYKRDGNNSLRRLASAKFNQKLSEYNSHTKHSNTVDGIVMMKGEDASGNLAFDGSYSFYLPSYGIVSGIITVTTGTYARGYYNGAYVNNNNFDGDGVAFTSQSDYADYTVTQYPVWLQGTWSGTFTDSCNASGGQIAMSVSDITATWWGLSMDRIYGTAVEIVEIDGSYIVRLKNDSAIWANDVKVNEGDTHIGGTWSYNGCSGSFSLHKCIK